MINVSFADVVENMYPGQFTAEPTLRHGFPHKPVSLAFDPVQRILAIGNRSGRVRVLGRPGVEAEIQHRGAVQVMQVEFVHNTGRQVKRHYEYLMQRLIAFTTNGTLL